MVKKIELNSSENRRLGFPMIHALLEGLTQAQGLQGRVMVMDVHDASILCNVALHEDSVLNKKSPDDKNKYANVSLRMNRVKKVESIRIVYEEEDRGYVEMRDDGNLPIEIIMPIVSYLVFAECGYQPSDTLEWEDGSSTLKDAFVTGEFEPLTDAIIQLFPENMLQLIYYLANLGILPLSPNENPNNLQELIHNEWYADYLLYLICQVALGKGIVKQLPQENEAPNSLIIGAESVLMLKEALEESGIEGTAKTAAYNGNSIGGYTYVTKQDANRNRHICLLGYYPVDNPKYGILVWLQRKEQIQDLVRTEWPELGEYAAEVCKRVIEILYDPKIK